MSDIATKRILILEPYYGGSHKQLLDILLQDYEEKDYLLLTLPAKKWHWRARTSALYFSQIIPEQHSFQIIFCTSVLNLAELIGIRPDLHKLKKIIYFHENQLVYPIEHIKERDFQYGYNQIVSCMSADRVIFNSEYNESSFLNNIQKHLNMQPGPKFKNIEDIIAQKSEVLYFPMAFSSIPNFVNSTDLKPVHIVWPHRWEHDKNPESFFKTLFEMKENGVSFELSVLGEHTTDIPEIFNEAKAILKDHLIHYGYAESKEKYYEILQRADIIVSTAKHEFFGVAMLEGTYCKCLPVVPNNLVYPEIYPHECLYNTDNQLYKILSTWCKYPNLLAEAKSRVLDNFPFDKYDAKILIPQYRKMFIDT